MDASQQHSTPVAVRRFKTRNWATTPGDCSLAYERRKNAVGYRAAIALDMAHKAVLLEPEEFLDNFLKAPCQHLLDTPPPLVGNPFEAIAGAAGMVESQISELFVAAVNNNEAIAQGLKMALSERMADVGESEGVKIDAAFFRPELLPTDGRPHWADQMVSVEFKSHGTANDPYDDREPGSGIDAHAATRKVVRGQIIHYAEKVFEYQQRTSLIMLVIVGRLFRFTRWDRSGTIVTRAVDYVEQPQVLYEMLWYMSRLSDEALGLDPTAHRVMPGSEEYAQMVAAKVSPAGLPDVDSTEGPADNFPAADAVFKYVREKFANSLDVNFPWYRLEVPDGDGTRYFLVGKPSFCAPGMAGRGTKGFVALEVGSCPARFAWLKDAWRTQYEFVAQEGAVLKELNDASVPYVPTLICHGDIPGQDTVTPTWWELKHNPPTASIVNDSTPPILAPQSVASSSRTLVNRATRSSTSTKRSASDLDDDGNGREECPLRRHKHYRIAVKEVAMKLVEFKHDRQLAHLMFDCIYAHKQAVVKANIMHRDISGGNILILPKFVYVQGKGSAYVKWTGLLADWELSKPLKGQASLPRPRQPERTGTWQFMSAAVLDNHSKKLEISDELESFFHVTLYYAVRYLETNYADTGSFIENYFDTYMLDNGTYKCGTEKSHTIRRGELPSNMNGDTLEFGSGFDDVFRTTLPWFKAHYAVERYKRHQEAQRLVKTTNTDLSIRPQSNYLLMIPEGFVPDPTLSCALQDDEKERGKGKEEVHEPSEEDLEDAAKLATHDAMLNVIYLALRRDCWKEKRVNGDNVSSDFAPKNLVGPPILANPHNIKKRRTHAFGRQNAPATVEPPFKTEPPRTPPRRGTVI
ncbi:hypothetical protein ACG7TL_006300 [Trametes sanguinea]